MVFAPPVRHLLRAKDLADARYFEPLGVDALARAAGLSRAHFSREFRRAFGESPHAYLLTRRLERPTARSSQRASCVSTAVPNAARFEKTTASRAATMPGRQTTSGGNDDQDLDCTALGQRPGRGARLLHEEGRDGSPPGRDGAGAGRLSL